MKGKHAKKKLSAVGAMHPNPLSLKTRAGGGGGGWGGLHTSPPPPGGQGPTLPVLLCLLAPFGHPGLGFGPGRGGGGG